MSTNDLHLWGCLMNEFKCHCTIDVRVHCVIKSQNLSNVLPWDH